MPKFLTLFLVTLVSFALLAPVADAKRMGGGKSFGMQRDNIGQQAAPRAPAQPSQAQNPAAGGAAAPAAGNRWMGPLAGLAAGGLLAALFMGGAFDGINAFDIVLLLGLAALIFFIVRAMRARAPQREQNMQYAGHGHTAPAEHTQHYQGGSLGGGAAPAVSQTRPAWFDEQNFLRTAKGHFIRLQAASDKGDLNDIREYTTPEVFSEIAMQIQERNGAVSQTEVMSVNAQLLDFVTEGNQHITSVRFYGTIREDNGPTESFDEIWHIQRAVNGDNNWYIAGIQQTPVGLSGQSS